MNNNEVSNMLASYLLEARLSVTTKLTERKRIIEIQKDAILRCAIDIFDLKDEQDVPEGVMKHLRPLNEEAAILEKLELIIGSEIYDLVKRAHEIVEAHSD